MCLVLGPEESVPDVQSYKLIHPPDRNFFLCLPNPKTYTSTTLLSTLSTLTFTTHTHKIIIFVYKKTRLCLQLDFFSKLIFSSTLNTIHPLFTDKTLLCAYNYDCLRQTNNLLYSPLHPLSIHAQESLLPPYCSLTLCGLDSWFASQSRSRPQKAFFLPINPIPHKMARGNTTRRGVNHTASQAPNNQPWKSQNQEPQASTAIATSQPSQPAQTQPQPLMRCCGKQNIRDCDCTAPDGSCLMPEFVFTHYHRNCLCYSCEWIREAKTHTIPDRIPPQSGLPVVNPTYCGNKMDHLPETDGSCTDLELVHPILLEENPQRWGWVFRPGNQAQLPFLASDSDCPDAVRVTLGSHGKWKALSADGTSYPLGYDMRPTENELYRDYGYAPGYSPVCTPSLPLSPKETLKHSEL